jgi:hypothetical protein
VLFSLELGLAPLPDVGGGGFRIETDPPEGASAFARDQMRNLLKKQRAMFPGGP